MIEALSEFRDILFPVFYVAFFGGTLVFLALANRRITRRIWVVGFLLTVLAVTAVGTPLMPVVDMHKFSQPTGQETTYYEFEVVDTEGNEIAYDFRATPPTTYSRSSSVAHNVVEVYSDDERLEIAEFYLSNAKEYRTEIESGDRSITERLQPPRYIDDRKWTADELEEYDEFEAIRVYERTITATDDNTAIESNEAQLRLTIDVTNRTITEHEGP